MLYPPALLSSLERPSHTQTLGGQADESRGPSGFRKSDMTMTVAASIAGRWAPLKET